MMRPKQVLPLYKGARNWLVAGSSCGSRANTMEASPASHPCDDQTPTRTRDDVSHRHLTGALKPKPAFEGPDPSLHEQVKLKGPCLRQGSVDISVYRALPLQAYAGGSAGGERFNERTGEHTQPAVQHVTSERATARSKFPGLRNNREFVPLETQDLGRGVQGGQRAAQPIGSRKSGLADIDGLSRKKSPTVSSGVKPVSRNIDTHSGYKELGTLNTSAPPPKNLVGDSWVPDGAASSIWKGRGTYVLPDGTKSAVPSTDKCLETVNFVSTVTNSKQVSNIFSQKEVPLADTVFGFDACKEGNDCSSSNGLLSTAERINEILAVEKGGESIWQGFGSSGMLQESTRAPKRHLKSHYRGKSESGSRNVVVDEVCSILKETRSELFTNAALDKLTPRLTSCQVNEILKNQNEVGVAMQFFQWVKRDGSLKHDLHTYTTMIGILGRAKCFDAMELLFQEMIHDGINPSVVTFNRLIHSYGKASLLLEALSIFRYMQTVGCEPDRVTYCTLIDVHAKEGLHDTAMQIYKQMLQAGLQPDTFTFSVIIHCLGKAGKSSAAHKVFREMLEHGCCPTIVTHNILLDLHAKAGNWRLAMKHYNDMQDAGFRPNKVTYSIMMEVLGNSGHIQEAEQVLLEMEQGGWDLDMPMYGLMIDMWGKAGDADKACQWYRRMLNAGLTPNVQICNSLGSAFLRLNNYEAAKTLLSGMSQLGLAPSLQTYTLLLSCCTTCKEKEHLDTVLHLLGNTGQPAHSFLCKILEAELQSDELHVYVEKFFTTLRSEDSGTRRGFADALIDFLHKLDCRAEAGCVWEVALGNHLYPLAVMEKDRNYWSVNLHVMSVGTALTALAKSLMGFKDTMLRTGHIPQRVEIVTGWGKRSKVTGSSLVKHAVEVKLGKLGSPFKIQDANVGCFISEGVKVYNWLHQPEVAERLAS